MAIASNMNLVHHQILWDCFEGLDLTAKFESSLHNFDTNQILVSSNMRDRTKGSSMFVRCVSMTNIHIINDSYWGLFLREQRKLNFYSK